MRGVDWPPVFQLDPHGVPFYLRGDHRTVWAEAALPGLVLTLALLVVILRRIGATGSRATDARRAARGRAGTALALRPADLPRYAPRGRLPLAVRLAAWPATPLHVLHQTAARQVRWAALWTTWLVFEGLIFLAEHASIMRGHWVYNTARLWGVKVWGVPLEEPVLWYSVPVFLMVFLYEVLAGLGSGTVSAHRAFALHWSPIRRVLRGLGVDVARHYRRTV